MPGLGHSLPTPQHFLFPLSPFPFPIQGLGGTDCAASGSLGLVLLPDDDHFVNLQLRHCAEKMSLHNVSAQSSSVLQHLVMERPDFGCLYTTEGCSICHKKDVMLPRHTLEYLFECLYLLPNVQNLQLPCGKPKQILLPRDHCHCTFRWILFWSCIVPAMNTKCDTFPATNNLGG